MITIHIANTYVHVQQTIRESEPRKKNIYIKKRYTSHSVRIGTTTVNKRYKMFECKVIFRETERESEGKMFGNNE